VFEELSGEIFIFEVLCTRDNEMCNLRRKADSNKNHKHEIILEQPTSFRDKSTFEQAIKLRQDCQRLGINPTTGPVKNVEERCTIYTNRIAEHYAALERAEDSKKRNQMRISAHDKQKLFVKEYANSMISRQCWEACHLNMTERGK
jgi:hypothetical protein